MFQRATDAELYPHLQPGQLLDPGGATTPDERHAAGPDTFTA